jgi:hypothetical protein
VSNTLTYVIPQLLAQGLMALREEAITARLVNRAYEPLAGQKGSSIDVPIPSAITARAVTAAVTMPANVDSSPTRVVITLDQWWEAPFQMSDKDLLEAAGGIMPMQASEAIKALANKMDAYLLGFYLKVPNYSGVAGTTPFVSTVAEYTDARLRLNKTLAPMTDRRVLLNPEAEANALKLALFSQADQRGDQGGVINGQIGRKLGADWFMNQNIPVHAGGSAGGTTTLSATMTVGQAILSIGACTPTDGTFAVGDTLKVGTGSTAVYFTVKTAATATASVAAVTVDVNAVSTASAGAAIEHPKGSQAINLMFHRDAFAFATRPLESSSQGLGNIISSAIDPVTGLTLRLEVSRQYKQTTFSYDILAGAQLIRPELACRILG